MYYEIIIKVIDISNKFCENTNRFSYCKSTIHKFIGSNKNYELNIAINQANKRV